MRKERLDNLRNLRNKYDATTRICDPVTYQVRQQELLHAAILVLLEELEHHEKAKAKLKNYEI